MRASGGWFNENITRETVCAALTEVFVPGGDVARFQAFAGAGMSRHPMTTRRSSSDCRAGCHGVRRIRATPRGFAGGVV